MPLKLICRKFESAARFRKETLQIQKKKENAAIKQSVFNWQTSSNDETIEQELIKKVRSQKKFARMAYKKKKVLQMFRGLLICKKII